MSFYQLLHSFFIFNDYNKEIIITLKGELFLSIAKRAYRNLQSHPYFSIFMLSFYLVYFTLAFTFFLLEKQFSDSSVQLNKIIATLDFQQVSMNSNPFKVLESLTTQSMAKCQYILMLIGSIGAFILLMIQLGLTHARKKEYQTYLLMGERVYKLTAQLVVEQLLLINSILLLLFTFYSMFSVPITNKITQLEAASLQSNYASESSSVASQEQSLSSEFDLKNEKFTRFTIDPFLKGDFVNHTFSQNNTLEVFFTLITINLYSSLAIGMPNYILLTLRKNKLS